MKSYLQLLVPTIALTVLIWAYADQAGHDVYQISVRVRYVPPPGADNPFVLRVADALTEPVDQVRADLMVRGPKSAIRRLEKDDAAGRFMLTVVVVDGLRPGSRPTRDLFEDLSRLAELRNRGLTLQRVSPDSVQLEVDQYRSVSLNLEVTAGVFEQVLVGKPMVKPDKVTARLLESSLSKISVDSPLRLSIEKELEARSEQMGSTFSFDLPVRSPWPGVEATFQPDQVRVTASLAHRIVRERITLITLSVLVEAQDFFGQYDIEWQDETGGHLTQAIDALVPSAKAGQLKGNMIDAYVTVEDADLPKELPAVVTTEPAATESWIERKVRFVFPAGFEDVKIEGPPRTVKFRIKKKSDTATASPVPLAPSR